MSDAVISFNLFGKELVLNPETYFKVGPMTIHWYGVIIAVGMILGLLYAMKRSNEFGLKDDDIIDMLLVVLPLGIIGARMLYVLGNFDRFKDDLVSVIKIWEGGSAIYGGIILGIVGLFVYCLKTKKPFAVLLDAAAMVLIIAQAIGRWGNFINREVYGVVTDMPWAMTLTLNGTSTSVHPLFLYESLWNAVGFILLHFYISLRRFDGEIFALYAGWYGLARVILEGLRRDSVLYLFGTNLRVSQMIGLMSVVAAAAYIIWKTVKKQTDPDKLYVNVLAAEAADEYIDEPETTDDKNEK